MGFDLKGFILFLGFIFLVVFLFSFFSGDKIIDTCPDVDLYKNYSDDEYRFGYNKIENYYVVVDSECEIVHKKYYFDEYFVNKYATIVNKTPENTLEKTEDVIEVTLKLLKDPLPIPQNELQKELIKELEKSTKSIKDIDVIISDYRNLYDASKYGILGDDILDEVELENVKLNTTLFVYDVIDKSGLLDNTKIIDLIYEDNNIFKRGFNKIISWFQNDEWYKEKKKEYVRNALYKIMFEEPIKFIYEDMKDKTTQ
ncbi:MAG: hypothetical protein KC589_03200 [Nanoarchaeota archaeon]|nr:hypothetical protein [Nanoarchaeota archaeon]